MIDKSGFCEFFRGDLVSLQQQRQTQQQDRQRTPNTRLKELWMSIRYQPEKLRGYNMMPDS